MRGESQATSIPSWPRSTSRSWFSWIVDVKRWRPGLSDERLEVIERLAREERRALQRGEHTSLPSYRRWS
jgi:hypothetical protein